MSRYDDISRVASRIGVTLRHVDALGVLHEPSVETLEMLLAALGLPGDPGEAEAALAEEGRAAFGLGPVRVIAAEEGPATLQLRDTPSAIEWRLHLEQGGAVAGAGAADEPGTFTLPPDLPLGYHRLELAADGETASLSLIVAPPECYLPPDLQPRSRCWGLTTQLYALRTANDWGMGDFSALAQLCAAAGANGAAAVGFNPLHALFAAEPRHVSPYSPSSRTRLNYLYIDVAAVPGFAEDEAARALAPEPAITAVRNAGQVDYAAVAALKRPVLEALFRRFQERELAAGGTARTARGAAFREFQRDGGKELAAFACFEALHEHFPHDYGNFSWRGWPAAMRNPGSAEVAEFARAHRDRIEFFQFLQWEADRQLGAAAAAGHDAGVSIGLYRDLAVGVDPHGAEAWADQELVAPGASIGAPPDALSRAGQNWGLAPVNPLVLRRRRFAPFVAALRANMRHAGVLRIDHVMSLQRLYWIPAGSPATTGAYLDYPFRDLLRLVALESHRQRCAIIGEDLGTVPEGFRETMRDAGVLSYRIFGFERRDDGSFVPPGDYPPLAAASAATHDLATLKGFWLGRDIDWRRRLALYPDAAAEATDTNERWRDRRMLLEALAREGLIARERFPEFLPEGKEPVFTAELGDAIHLFLARSRARLMLVQLEDIFGEAEQANLPGTTDAHPNWCRRMSNQLEDIVGGQELRRIAALVAQGREYSAAHADGSP
jgi:4-alpha-glucanotransferase